MLFKEHKTVLQSAIYNTIKEFGEAFDTSNVNVDENNFIKDGATLIRCKNTSSAFNELLKNGQYTFSENAEKEIVDAEENKSDSEKTIQVKEVNNFFDSMTNSIININNAGNYKECVELLKTIHNDIGTSMFGALLISDEIIINPFHVATAMIMSDEKKQKELHDRIYRIAIYAINESTEELYNKVFNSDIADFKFINESLNNIVKVSSHQVESFTKIVGNTINGENIEMKYKTGKYEEEQNDYDYYLSAHQLLTKGIVMPWYGASIIKVNGNTEGKSVSPMLTCNISGIESTINSVSNTRESKKNNMHSVCTGSSRGTQLNKLRSLNHANLKSPFNTRIVAPGALVYAQLSVIKSLEIYNAAEFIDNNINKDAVYKKEEREQDNE